MISFHYQQTDFNGNPEGKTVDIKLTDPGVSLSELIESFETLLLAAGYSFEGRIGIVEND